jgi:hypothetical protein
MMQIRYFGMDQMSFSGSIPALRNDGFRGWPPPAVGRRFVAGYVNLSKNIPQKAIKTEKLSFFVG